MNDTVPTFWASIIFLFGVITVRMPEFLPTLAFSAQLPLEVALVLFYVVWPLAHNEALYQLLGEQEVLKQSEMPKTRSRASNHDVSPFTLLRPQPRLSGTVCAL